MVSKKNLHIDNKKRITVGKLISNDITHFEVTKNKDGCIVLKPCSSLPPEESWIYRNKVVYKSLKKSVRELGKNLVTRIDKTFWKSQLDVDYLYSAEFLRNFASALSSDSELCESLKSVLPEVNQTNSLELRNFKGEKGESVFIKQLDSARFTVVWCYKNNEVVILNLLKHA